MFLAKAVQGVEDFIRPLSESLAGRTLVDCPHPFGPGPKHRCDSQGTESREIGSKAFMGFGYE